VTEPDYAYVADAAIKTEAGFQMKRFSWLCASVSLFFAPVVLSGCGSGPSGPTGSVTGGLDKDCGFGGCASDLAKDKLSGSSWCIWNGSDVMVHLRLKNALNAHVTASITPRYEIKDGGTHGDSFGSDQKVSIAAAVSREVALDAGHPEGVADGTTISKCDPRLVDIDITNP
jgi:hypothetical protein